MTSVLGWARWTILEAPFTLANLTFGPSGSGVTPSLGCCCEGSEADSRALKV